MAAEEHLGKQFLVYHGTNTNWSRLGPGNPDRPFHVSTDPDLPSDHAADGGVIKVFSVHPDAKIHRTDSQHLGIEMPLEREERDRVLAEGHDLTIFNDNSPPPRPGFADVRTRGEAGVVWNTSVLRHVMDIPHRRYVDNPYKYGPKELGR